MKLIAIFNTKFNLSRMTLWISPKRESVKVIVWIIVHMLLPLSTQLIVVVFVVIMANCIRTAIRFRQASTTAPMLNKTSQKCDSQNDSSKVFAKLTGKKSKSTPADASNLCSLYLL